MSKFNIGDQLTRFLDETKVNCEKKVRVVGLRTGSVDFDKQGQGLIPGELVVIAGRPSSGKTSLLLSWATNIAIGENKHVMLFSTDHPISDVTMRMMAGPSRIETRRLRVAMLSDREWTALAMICEKFAEAPISLFESGWLSVASIRTQCIHTHEVTGVPPAVILIDKFHSLVLGDTPAEGANNRTHELFQIVVELKQLAREFQVPVVLICDINKGMEAKSDKRPQLVDIRDYSGAIESYADQIVFLYRDENYSFNSQDRGVGELIIAKTRYNTSPIRIRMAFLEEYSAWYNLHDDPIGVQGSHAIRPPAEIQL